MTDQEELNKLIGQSLREIKKNSQHHLPLGYRYAILANLSSDEKLCRKRQVALGIMTAEKVLPMWSEQFKEDVPIKALQLAKDVFQEKVNKDEAKKLADRYSVDMDDPKIIEKITKKAHESFSAGYTAIKALYIAAYGGYDYPKNVDLSENDEDLDGGSSTTEYYACVAYSGHTKVDPNKRLEFWIWWLTEAIPSVLANTTYE